MKEQVKYAAGWLNTVLILGALAASGYWYGTIEGRMHETPKKTLEMEMHAEEAKEIIKEIRETAAASKENSEAAIKSRANRDTILQKALDISNRNAVTVYEMKKKVDSINKFWVDYNNSSGN